MRITAFSRCLLLLVTVFLLPMVALAQQASGTIEGIIKDNTGAVIAGAEVVVTSLETAQTRTVNTNESGFYRVSSLPVGKYSVKISVQGFAPTERTGVNVTVGSVINTDINLEVGNVGGDIVTVTAEAPVVEPTRTQISTTVDERSVKDLPVNGRNFIEFVLLTPGVSSDPRGGDISFGGLRGTNNSLQIDGSDNNNTFFGQSLGRTGSGRAPYQFSKDAVKEFQVNTNAYSAEYGRAGGAVINVVTKSGSNEFHGGGFLFFRDRSLNAEEPFAKARKQPKGRNRFYQFGAVFSGPIVKDKTFFFFNYDGQRNSEPNPVFPAIAIPTDPVSQSVFQQLTAQGVFNAYNREFNQDVFLGKVDHQLTNRDRVTVRYNHQKFTGTNLENSGNQSAAEHTGNSNVNSDTVTASVTSVFTPRLVNEARFQYARDNEPGQANGNRPEAVIRLGSTNLISFGQNSFSPRQTLLNRYQIIDSVAYTIGTHALKFGIDINIERIKNFFPGNFSGVYNFTSLADFADGIPGGSFIQNFPGAGTPGPLSRPNNFEFSYYAQDDWRATSRLKIYYGIRYDYQRLQEPKITNPDVQLANANINTGRLNQDLNNFGPRVGFSYALTNDNKTVLRAGYGVFYSRTPSIVTGTAITNNGIQVQSFTLTGSAVPVYPNILAAPPSVNARQNIFIYDEDFVQPLIQQGSVGLERELPGGIGVSVSYLLVKGTHLLRARDINQGPVSLVTLPVSTGGAFTVRRFGARPFTNFSRITQFVSDGSSIYHGLAVQASKRYSKNFQLLFSYTFSKALDDKPDSTAVVVGADDAKFLADALAPGLDRGLGDADVKHRAVLSGVYDLNFATMFGASNGIAKQAFDGFSLSGIFTATSGRPFSATVPSDINNDGNSRTDRVPGVGRNTLRGPNFYQLDMRLSKSFKPTETTKLEFIGEAFNLTNRTNVSGIDTNRFFFDAPTGRLLPNRTFLAPTSTVPGAQGKGANRQFQLAIKFDF